MAFKKGKLLNIYTKDYVVFDLETTGLSPIDDEIIEISGIKVRSGQALEEFTSLVNPNRPIPVAATNINGITDDMVKEAPYMGCVLEQFLQFIGNDILVGHNIHSFDMQFLYNGAARELHREISNQYIDTLYLAKSCLPRLPRHRLTDIAAYFKIDIKGAHRALNDCNINLQCYEQLGCLLLANPGGTAEQPVSSCPKCGGILMKRKGKFGEFWGCGNFPQCRYTKNISTGNL